MLCKSADIEVLAQPFSCITTEVRSWLDELLHHHVTFATVAHSGHQIAPDDTIYYPVGAAVNL